MNKKITPFIISTGLHLSVLVLLFLNMSAGMYEDNGKDGTGQNVAFDKKIIPKQVEVEIIETLPDGDYKSEENKNSTKECVEDLWFGGIGIEQEWPDRTITAVHDGYPAKLVGIEVGDQIISVDGQDRGSIRGEPGTKVIIVVFRKSINKQLTFSIIRDKICVMEDK